MLNLIDNSLNVAPPDLLVGNQESLQSKPTDNCSVLKEKWQLLREEEKRVVEWTNDGES